MGMQCNVKENVRGFEGKCGASCMLTRYKMSRVANPNEPNNKEFSNLC